MAAFFQGGRRKTGGVTLLIALVFMVAWVRSGMRDDWVRLEHSSARALYTLSSRNGGITVLKRHPHASSQTVSWGTGVVSKDQNPLTGRGVKKPYDLWNEFKIQGRFDGAGFHFGKGEHHSWHGEKSVQLWIVPYWSIVMPLTLVSALFLLVRPRTKPALKSQEPAPDHDIAMSPA